MKRLNLVTIPLDIAMTSVFALMFNKMVIAGLEIYFLNMRYQDV
ncbi:MAG: hypothetical protein PWQ97_1414 [Tepidanaerobacteraceae bacterium]|nr:hypothetical protein [Tepidanaerobacteraceae bacterium]